MKDDSMGVLDALCYQGNLRDQEKMMLLVAFQGSLSTAFIHPSRISEVTPDTSLVSIVALKALWTDVLMVYPSGPRIGSGQ